jgi:23S rRNA (cytidine1920-2'-O)/16S rRNA (cytidine1409-2'-O)-methyltransferase
VAKENGCKDFHALPMESARRSFDARRIRGARLLSRTSPNAVPAQKLRLDQLLVTRGLVESREKAQRAIMAGEVTVAERVIDKPGTRVASDASVTLREHERYVSRGGLKLEAALQAFSPPVTGAICLDIGASTGGFTDCLLQHGAAKVYAIDVGHAQMAWKIRADPRVIVREKVNARYLEGSDFPEPIDLCVIDVSFISLTLILRPAFELLRCGGMLIALIKPQFELSRQSISKGGIVRDPLLHDQAVAKVRAFVEEGLQQTWCGCIASPILGAEGNKEFLACLRAASA